MDDLLKGVIEDFAKDSKKETDGVYMPYKRHRFLIARAHRNNPKFLAMMEAEMRPYQWMIDRNNMKDAIKAMGDVVLKKVYAHTILLGISDLNGTALPYSPQDGIDLFGKLPDLWDEVVKFATNESNFSAELEVNTKN